MRKIKKVMNAKFKILILILIILQSCSIQKRQHFKGYTFHWRKASTKIETVKKIDNDTSNLSQIAIQNVNLTNDFTLKNETSNINLSKGEIENQVKHKLLPNDTLQCDKILLKDGNEISGKVLEISQKEVKYKKCNNIDGPLNITDKKNVFMITYANGTKDIFKDEPVEKEENSTNSNNSSNKRVNGFALTGFILSLVGFSVLALIFCAIGNKQIQDNPNRYTGKGFAAAGTILGIIWLFVLIIILLL